MDRVVQNAILIKRGEGELFCAFAAFAHLCKHLNLLFDSGGDIVGHKRAMAYIAFLTK